MIPVDYISKNLSPGGSLSAAGIFCLFGRVAPFLPYLDTTGTIAALPIAIYPFRGRLLRFVYGVKMKLSEISRSDSLWDYRRLQAHYLAQLYAMAGNLRYSQRLSECSNVLEFSAFPDSSSSFAGAIKLSLSSARFCRVRLCPICLWRKSMKSTAKFLAVLPEILKEGGDKFILLTLTVKNCPVECLRSTVADMNAAWRRMINRRHFRDYCLGWFRSLEVTRNFHTNYAHPHFHCLIQVSPSYFGRGYLSQAKWAEIWQESLRSEYSPIVDVRRIVNKNNVDFQDISTSSDIAGAACECMKYISKSDTVLGLYAPGDDPETDRINSEWLETYTAQIFGLRTFASGGIIKKSLKLADEYSDDELVFIDGQQVNLNERLARLLALWNLPEKSYLVEV